MADLVSARCVELAQRLHQLDERIRAACAASDRQRADVTVIVVTKTWPAEDVRRLAGLGVTDVGENRDQEAREKASMCSDLALRWHFVGRVQTNKAASIARYADVVHSVDRPELVRALAAGAQRAQRRVDVLVQVSLDPAGAADTRGGALPAIVPTLCDEVGVQAALRLAGVMGVAPNPDAAADERGGGPATAARAFELLAQVAADVRIAHPQAGWISAGMSGDLEQAVRAGATHLRVGTAVLGSRPLLR